MVATPSVENSEARVFTIFDSSASEILLSEARIFSIYNFPSESEQLSQVRVLGPVLSNVNMQISEARVFAIVKGRIENRRLRSGTFPLDGHDFWFLRLGERGTLIYDLTTEQWMQWDGNDLPFWRPNCSWNWIGMGKVSFSQGANTKIVMGDDVFGLLWTLDPDQGYDEAPRVDLEDQEFTRQVVGGMPMRMRETQKVGAAYLTADMGTPQLTGANITLRTSDDYGKTWNDHGPITVEPDNYNQEFVWRSLGLIKHPGRMFEITDNGASVRIDGLDIR